MRATPLFALLLASCAATGPLPEDELKNYRERLITRSDGDLTVSTSVLSDVESEAVYGVPLAEKGIQPVWVEVENHDETAYWLLSPGLDPNFFPASEAADAFAGESRKDNRKLTKRFEQLAFKNPVPPGGMVSGFVLSNHDEGVKMVQVDLVASGHLKSFSTISTVPGFYADYKERSAFTQERYTAEEVINYTSDESFRAALEA
ncbi:MAG: hypothetical protein WBN95_06925, partial [Gammaproteobacteria bacterium]